MKKLIIVSVIYSLLLACKGNGPEILTVEGTFANAVGKKIMLAELPFTSSQRLVADSATIDSTGHFTLSTIQQQEGMYQLFVQDGPGILFINDTNHIVFTANIDSLGAYKVANSVATQSLKSLYNKLSALQLQANATTAIADSIAKIPLKQMTDSMKAPYFATRDKSLQTIREFLVAYLNMEKNATAQWYGLGVATHFLPKEEWAVQVKKAVALHPQHPGLTLMKVSLAAAEQQENMGKALLNKPVPNIVLQDTAGKPVSVISYKGKWLLIDFWASWCGPCRAENPNLVATYKQFKNKNFNILGISLDDNKDAWIRAIKKDSLTWAQVSDLKQWEGEAVKRYEFNAIPFNILVDTAGTVIATNLHGAALVEKLKAILK
jgi:thiol-disulfide isomerase/thioredoxin